MKKILLLSSVIGLLLFSCADKKNSPEPPKIEGKWRYLGSTGYRNSVSTNGITTPFGWMRFLQMELEFIPNSSNLNVYNANTFWQSGQYFVNNNTLKLDSDTLGFKNSDNYFIDSLTHNKLVFKSDTFPEQDGFTFYIHRLER